MCMGASCILTYSKKEKNEGRRESSPEPSFDFCV
jgi:hypothetical protein